MSAGGMRCMRKEGLLSMVEREEDKEGEVSSLSGIIGEPAGMKARRRAKSSHIALSFFCTVQICVVLIWISER